MTALINDEYFIITWPYMVLSLNTITLLIMDLKNKFDPHNSGKEMDFVIK